MSEIKRLQQKHFKILELSLEGMSKVNIARELNLTPVTIHNVTNSPIFRHEFAKRNTERQRSFTEADVVKKITARDVLNEASLGAAGTQVGLLGSSNEKISQVAAMDILDRTGNPRMTRSENQSVNATIILDEAALKRLSRASKEAFGEDFPIDAYEQGGSALKGPSK